MSLYEDIGTAIGSSTSSSSTATTSIKLLQEHLRVKKSLLQQKSSTIKASNVNVRNNIIELNEPTFGNNDHEEESSSLLGGDWDVAQEYDPFKPNDYEKVVRDKERKKKEDKERAALQVQAIRSFVPYYSDDNSSGDETGPIRKEDKSEGKAAIPPPLDLTSPVLPPPPPSVATISGANAAKMMMAKMGYKDGQGLGRDAQGMSQPLEIVKVGPGSQGVIVKEDKVVTTPSTCLTELVKQPTRIVLLTNMVGPGEVDADLEPETKEECDAKYGEVVKCVIFECPPGSVAPEEAVRIFLEFKRIESAIKAVVDLNGRFFGGRSVRASFFDPHRFQRLDLKP